MAITEMGSGAGGAITVANDNKFAGATLAACRTARDAFFTANPTRILPDMYILLLPTGASAQLEQRSGAGWQDMGAVIDTTMVPVSAQVTSSNNNKAGFDAHPVGHGVAQNYSSQCTASVVAVSSTQIALRLGISSSGVAVNTLWGSNAFDLSGAGLTVTVSGEIPIL